MQVCRELFDSFGTVKEKTVVSLAGFEEVERIWALHKVFAEYWEHHLKHNVLQKSQLRKSTCGQNDRREPP